ncbi:hypothetical protein HanPSC8_Chr09g0374431 [Helianthus annuus]|nr:hypothetical protein HanPSC8_Chr09g0374431 [Helianthus annuus]
MIKAKQKLPLIMIVHLKSRDFLTRQTPVGNKESGASNGRSKKIKGKKRIAGKKVEVQRSNQKRASRGGGGGEVGGVGALQWWKKCWLALICKGV